MREPVEHDCSTLCEPAPGRPAADCDTWDVAVRAPIRKAAPWSQAYACSNMNVCLGLGMWKEKSDAWPRCEVSEGVSDEDASDVDKGDFYAEKGASKSGCGCTLGIGDWGG